MNIHGFSEEGQWYKGNIHCHTTVSDGHLTPAEVTALYKSLGYDFLAISDHNVYTDFNEELGSEDFLIIPAVEHAAALEHEGSPNSLKVHHIHGILGPKAVQERATEGLFNHLDKVPVNFCYETWDGQAEAQKISDELRAHGCVVMYNHPIWSRVRESEFINTTGLTAIEIYNYGTVIESGTGYDTVYWDTLLREGHKIWGVATDDNHNGEALPDSGGGFIVVKAAALTQEAIMQSFVDGNFYASSGPQIYDWGIHDGVAYVTCSAVEHVNFIVGNLVGSGATVSSEDGTDAVDYALYRLNGHETYIRVECVDSHGKTAWSNPIFLKNEK